jgi:hypothetical protein
MEQHMAEEYSWYGTQEKKHKLAGEETNLANWLLSALTCLLAASARRGSKVAGPAITC